MFIWHCDYEKSVCFSQYEMISKLGVGKDVCAKQPFHFSPLYPFTSFIARRQWGIERDIELEHT